MNKNVIGLGAALIVGVIAFAGTMGVITKSQNTYLVAAQPIHAGDTVTAKSFQTVTVRGTIQGASTQKDQTGLVGQTAVTTIPQGAVVTATDFSKTGGNVVEENLDPGMMAYTVPADNIVGVTPGLHPGDYVNVYTAWQYTAAQGQPVQVDFQLNSQPLKVLDVQKDTTQSSPTVAGVTIEIPSSAGTSMDFFVNYGKIHLALIAGNNTDKPAPPTTSSSVAQALNLK